MKLLMCRGAVPSDRSYKEIMYNDIESETDLWTHIAHNLGDEVEILYYGKPERKVRYNDKTTIVWTNNLRRYNCSFHPSHIWNRGGFEFFKPVLKRYKDAYLIYYGSGARYRPKDGIAYNLVLVDSERQLAKAGPNARLWIKPAIDTHFKYMPEVRKRYDVCYVGDCRFPFRAKIKGQKLAYQCPPDLKMLHLGWSGKAKVPKNIKVKRVIKEEMPRFYNQCKVLVAPYSSYDSAPRCIPEAIACNLMVICLDGVNIWEAKYPVGWAGKNGFWDLVRLVCTAEEDVRDPDISMKSAIDYLKGLINE